MKIRMMAPSWLIETKAGPEPLEHHRRDHTVRLSDFKATPTHDWPEHVAQHDELTLVEVRCGTKRSA
jgi:hypothetical protein